VRRWLDGALGMHTSVATSRFEAQSTARPAIEWGARPQADSGTDERKLSGQGEPD
jgi:hypothetical protein